MSGHAPRIDLPKGARGAVADQLDAALDDLSAAAMRAAAVDPLITELVRLRCAQVHDCRRCGALRLQEAIEQGFDEAMNDKIARYQTGDLGAPAIAALRLCDALILAPGSADAALRDELSEHFSDEQIAELCLDVVKWSYQKVLVALRLEEPPGQTTLLAFAADGSVEVGGSTPSDEDSL